MYINHNIVFGWYGMQGMHTSHNIRDLDRDEGAALHAHLFEEQIDWTEPLRKHSSVRR